MASNTPLPQPLHATQIWWLLAAGMAAGIPLTQQVPLWLAALSALAFCWRALLAWQRRSLPARWILILVSLIGAAGVLAEYRTLFGQRAGVALLVLFLALKQLEARMPRDGLAVVLLCYFLTLAQFFQNQSILVALTMIVTLITSTAALASLADPHARPLQLVRLSGTLLAQALPFMLILFVLFPRVSGPLWGLPTDAYSSLTGLSDNMSPGAINNLIQSDAIAFRVKFDGPPPQKREMYWRGPVLTRLEGRTWRPGTISIGEGVFYQPREESPVFIYTVTLEPHNKRWLFGLEFPTVLPPDAIGTSDFQLLARKPVRERQRYAIRSRTEVTFMPESSRTLAESLQVSDVLNPRTVELGARWAAAGGTGYQRLQRAIEFLRAQQLTYTLRPPLMSEHVADEFLFDHRRGFCEHFSSSFVVLMRAAGVPARVVTGYQGGERNPVDDTWVIRQSDAHAWAEVWLEHRGWVRVDPTAISVPNRIEQNLAAAIPAGEPLPFLAGAGLDWLRDIRYRWWAVSNTWNQWVLGYDPARQRDFLEKLGMSAPDWRSMTAVLTFLCGLVLLGLIAGMLWRRPRLDPVEREWRKLSDRLGKTGLARHAWEGPRDYAQRIACAQPTLATEINCIATLYGGLRYGNLPSRQLAELRQRIAALSP
jgi:transglutaminase-like putative cysteine protease